ncbi:YbhB/YbcL family Raf kinase inhibitor-like protein [Hamadaea tsunoensis]|uniref:YbhB/YbcL family Raf kinase inhibitor-like protein n=1 Tax=Hamadaea tsunoensis TaxID=53368 RepID=UPI0004272A6F|nr:YbhB/YbcL family Raf kinase inhibitor-like protein [Hamadaea tsunoensis]
MAFDRPDPYAFLRVPAFDASSADLADGSAMPLTHVNESAGGGNLSPHLAWSGAPAETRGYAVTCFDPDAPTVCGFWHWLLVGVPADQVELVTGAGAVDGKLLPGGALQLTNDFCENAYDGAAPPAGDGPHRYIFAVHALDTDDLGLDDTDRAGYISYAINKHTIARATLTVHYER